MINSFADFGSSFQEKFVQALLVDQKFAEDMLEVFDPKYIESKHLSFLTEKYFSHAKKYKTFPSFSILLTLVKDALKTNADEYIQTQIISYLQKVKLNPDPGDLPYVKDKSIEFCRKQALKKAIENAISKIDSDSEKYDSIVSEIKKATQVGTSPSMGHDFFVDYEARFTRLSRDCIPTGIAELDQKDILNGGMGKGELFVVVACSGVGKSHFLTALGANALRMQKNVLHYTFELAEHVIGVRYDSNLCDINASDVIDSKDQVMDKYKNMSLGKLIIKHFPSNSASVFTLRAHMERLELKGFKPDLVIVDYADIMRSTREYDSLRHELKLIYEELRSLADEKGFPIATASQSNKEGASSEIIDMTNMSEAYGKAHVADFILGLSRRVHEKATGLGRIYIAKNRSGRDGLVYPIKIDTSRSSFTVVGESSTPADANKENEEDIKATLRSKWKELQREKIVSETTSNKSRD